MPSQKEEYAFIHTITYSRAWVGPPARSEHIYFIRLAGKVSACPLNGWIVLGVKHLKAIPLSSPNYPKHTQPLFNFKLMGSCCQTKSNTRLSSKRVRQVWSWLGDFQIESGGNSESSKSQVKSAEGAESSLKSNKMTVVCGKNSRWVWFQPASHASSSAPLFLVSFSTLNCIMKVKF